MNSLASEKAYPAVPGSKTEPTVSPPLPLLHRPLARWTALFLLWTVVGLVFVMQYYIFHLTEKVVFTSGRALWTVLGWYPWIVLTPLVVHLARRMPIERPLAGVRLARHFGIAFLLSVVEVAFVVAVMGVAWTAAGEPFDWARSFRIAMLRSFYVDILVYMVIVAVVHALDYYQKYRERDLRTAHLEVQLVQAQLQALRMQLNPHFLFNTLHAISSLMTQDVKAGRRMIAHLSDLLRLALDRAGENEVTVEEELDFLRHYLEIEETRFQDRLTITLDVAPATLRALVPNLLLQPGGDDPLDRFHAVVGREQIGPDGERPHAERGAWLVGPRHHYGI